MAVAVADAGTVATMVDMAGAAVGAMAVAAEGATAAVAATVTTETPWCGRGQPAECGRSPVFHFLLVSRYAHLPGELRASRRIGTLSWCKYIVLFYLVCRVCACVCAIIVVL